MEIVQYKRANKTIEKALSTFTDAAQQVNKAIELKEASIKADKDEMTTLENEIRAIESRIDELQANIIAKQGEISKHKDLAEKLADFSFGGKL